MKVISFLLFFLISDSSGYPFSPYSRTCQCSLRVYIFLSRDNPRLNCMFKTNYLCSKYTIPGKEALMDPTGGRFRRPLQSHVIREWLLQMWSMNLRRVDHIRPKASIRDQSFMAATSFEHLFFFIGC